MLLLPSQLFAEKTAAVRRIFCVQSYATNYKVVIGRVGKG